MKLLRSWPARIPTGGRNYVVDTLPKLVIDNYDYAPLADVGDDVILIEWDVAVDREGLDAFIAHAHAGRGRVVVAPYRLYVSTVHGHPLREPVWAHRRADGTHVADGEPACAMFGFGLIYLPAELIAGFRADWPGHVSDGSFSGWHRRHVTAEVPIAWDVRPVHLHYPLERFGTDAGGAPAPPVVLTRLPDPGADERAAGSATDPIVAGLLRERAGLARRGLLDRLAAVNEQLAARGFIEPEPRSAHA